MKKLRSRTGYGVDLAGGRAVVVRSAANRRFETVYDGPSGGMPAAVSALSSGVSSGRALAAGCQPVAASLARMVQAPFASVKKAVKVLPSLLDIQLPFPLENCTYRFLDVRRTGDHVRALALAAQTDAVRQRLQQHEDAGVVLTSLDHEGLALWTESIEDYPIEPDAVRVVACIGYENTVLVIGRGLVFESAHHCPVGFERLQGGGETAADDLVRRVRNILQAGQIMKSGQKIQWAWTGPGAADESLRTRLESSLDLAPEMIRLVHREPATMLARALSRRVLLTDRYAVDFIEGDRANPMLENLRLRRLCGAAVFYFVLGLLLIGLNAGWNFWLSAKESDIAARIQNAAEDLAPGTRIYSGQEILLVARAREANAPNVKPFTDAFAPSPAMLLRDLLDAAVAANITFSKLSLRPDAAAVSGASLAWADCEKLVPVFAKYGFTVSEPQREDAGADERVHFNLSAGIANVEK
ncbi:MAG: hypothetical protein AB7T27_05285 [Kiritimatiellia bacterium]